MLNNELLETFLVTIVSERNAYEMVAKILQERYL